MLSDIHNLPSIKKTIWCTQKAMAVLFDVGIPAISKHLTNVFETGELSEEATISKMETVQHEGNRDCIYIPNLIWMQKYAFQKCDKVFGTYYVVHERVIFQFNGI